MVRRRRASGELRKEILKYLEKQSFGRTTGQIANAIKISWESANNYLRKMRDDGLVYYEKVGRQNQWCLAKYYKHGFKLPVKTK